MLQIFPLEHDLGYLAKYMFRVLAVNRMCISEYRE